MSSEPHKQMEELSVVERRDVERLLLLRVVRQHVGPVDGARHAADELGTNTFIRVQHLLQWNDGYCWKQGDHFPFLTYKGRQMHRTGAHSPL